jgi:hypothetical protein
MGKLNIKNGTPVGSENLCRSCSWAQFTTGYRESDLLVVCTNTSPNIVVPFVVLDCTEFNDKSKPDWEQMQKLAINIQPVRTSRKTRGFSVPVPVVPVAESDDGVEEVEDEVAGTR